MYHDVCGGFPGGLVLSLVPLGSPREAAQCCSDRSPINVSLADDYPVSIGNSDHNAFLIWVDGLWFIFIRLINV